MHQEIKCNGQYINDCPHSECECAKRYLEEQRAMEEDYTEEAEAISISAVCWVLLILIAGVTTIAALIDYCFG